LRAGLISSRSEATLSTVDSASQEETICTPIGRPGISLYFKSAPEISNPALIVAGRPEYDDRVVPGAIAFARERP